MTETLVVSGDTNVTGQMYLGPNSNDRRPFAKPSNWGYSSGYKAIVLGSASATYNTSISGAVTLSFNYDPSGNSNGSFSGNGNEILFRNGTQFVTPNSADDAFNLKNLVLKDGYVGIGTATPTSTLHVTSTTANTNGMVRFQNNMDNNYETLRIESLGDYDAHIGFFADGSSNYYWGAGVDYSDSGAFKIANDNLLATNTKFTIHTSGCVGVGSTTDRSLGTNIGTLVVNGSAGGGLWLSPGDSSAMTSKIYAEANGSVGDLIINNGTGVGSGGMRFQTNAAQKMMLDSAGRLLINQTSSNLTYAKLQVSEGSASAGHGGIVGFFDTDVSVGSSNVIQVLWFSADDDATGGVFTRFRDGNSIMGQIEAANGTQVSYGVSSDERLKENIVDASSQLNTIKNIKVREFDWKANGYHEVGMIAQELHTVVPSAVQEGGDDLSEQPWGVDYSKLTPYLIKAVQELSAKNDALEARIATLEG
jgi:hypothetical protein